MFKFLKTLFSEKSIDKDKLIAKTIEEFHTFATPYVKKLNDDTVVISSKVKLGSGAESVRKSMLTVLNLKKGSFVGQETVNTLTGHNSYPVIRDWDKNKIEGTLSSYQKYNLEHKSSVGGKMIPVERLFPL